MGKVETELGATATAIAEYIDAHFFDPNGIMYAEVDAYTGRPFAAELLTPIRIPRRADVDPWAYWAYEDSVQNTGILIDGLMRKHEVTGDADALARAHRHWLVLRNVYSASQVHGIGSFLRPYGGYKGMDRFAEPLGTDQASPMFAGLYLYMKHASQEVRVEIADVLLKSVRWYEQQGFQYFYYKSFIHEWNPTYQHAASYYLPATAWAAAVTGEAVWKRHLEEKLALFENPLFTPARSFCWGSDLPVLAELLGERFWKVFELEKMRSDLHAQLAQYSEPGRVKRECPESTQPGFKPSIDPAFDREVGMGFAYFATRHQGRFRPRQEMHALVGLAALGVPGAFEDAMELMALRKCVPEDFTHHLFEDRDVLPESVDLYARNVGGILVEWWRNYWFLRQIEALR